MKKILFALILILGTVGNAFAQKDTQTNDYLYIEGAQVPVGGTAKVALKLLSQERQYLAFQFNMVLPEGISASADDFEVTDRLTAVAKQWSISPKLIDAENNEWNVIVYNMPQAYMDGADGEVLYFNLTADASLEIGSKLEGTLKGMVLSTKEQKYTPADRTFEIEIVEDRVIFDETSASLPLYTAGEKKNVRMTRTIKANTWSTIVLPFTLAKSKAEEIFGNDVKLAEFDGFKTEYADEEDLSPDAITLNFKKVTLGARTSMTGGKLYLIKTSKDIDKFDADEVTLADKVTEVSKTDEYETTGKFTGSFVKTVVPADGLFINSEKFYYSTGKTNIKAFRGWFELKAVLDKDTDFGAKVSFTVDGDATEIDGFTTTPRVIEGVYDLSGRKIKVQNNDLNTLQKGVYIIDGKKVTIK